MHIDSLPEETDLLVIGAGPGGYVAAIRAAQLGLDVVLVDDDALGGTCLNHGCIPSKALLSATGRVDDVLDAEHMGIYADPYVDIEELIDWKDSVVDQLTGGVGQLCRSAGVQFQQGRASFVDDHTAWVEHADGTDEFTFEHAIVATGSRSIEVPGFDFTDDPVLDSRQALSPETVPERLVVVGAGYIGLELAFVYARLGTDVVVCEMLDGALPGFDAALTDVVEREARDHGIEFAFGERAAGWERDGNGVIVETEAKDGTRSEWRGDRVLVAVGRDPITDTVGLENADIDTTDAGFVKTDERGRTSAEHVYAVGDVAGEPMLAHKASHEGLLAAADCAGDPVPDHALGPVPAVVFTDPEIGTVGATPKEAADDGHDDTAVGEFPLGASGRALAASKSEGFVRVVGDADSGRLLGGQVVGPEASGLVAELALAIRHDHTLADVADTIHAHPTFSEAVMEAAADALGRSVHTP
ncbi:dihydrolipoyl dehydrogenase [Haladaptatus halobius]|uniref:dihydrolipoyl dehydrogenase n=1 Tax=Haladaptatus halobius TaxID=2884875 RepID=UPI001D0A035F|nr:dihydrolipoyl dehydrogenase [Haladaptatus halobius]